MKTIITHPNFDYLWEQIVKDNEWKISKADVNFEAFEDWWPNIFVEKVKELIEHKDVTYIWDFSKPQDLFLNYAIINWILDYYADKVRVIMPYFPVGTMERIDEKWQIATAKYFADIMSNLPSGRNWKTSVHIFDIHALQERFYFDSRNVNAEIHTAMNLLDEIIKWKIVVFPDEWAKKRFWRDFPDNVTLSFSKIRMWNERVLTLNWWDVDWKDVLLIDDLIQTWNTIIEATKILREKWAKSVTAFATHGVFPNWSVKKLSKEVDKLIVSDSIPKNISRAEKIKNMEIISLKSDIEKLIFNW